MGKQEHNQLEGRDSGALSHDRVPVVSSTLQIAVRGDFEYSRPEN